MPSIGDKAAESDEPHEPSVMPQPLPQHQQQQQHLLQMTMHVYPFPHALGPTQQPPLIRAKRRQVKNACTNCQKACKKCDDARPCLRCVKYGISDDCVDSQRKERKRGVKRGPYKKRDGKGVFSSIHSPFSFTLSIEPSLIFLEIAQAVTSTRTTCPTLQRPRLPPTRSRPKQAKRRPPYPASACQWAIPKVTMATTRQLVCLPPTNQRMAFKSAHRAPNPISSVLDPMSRLIFIRSKPTTTVIMVMPHRVSISTHFFLPCLIILLRTQSSGPIPLLFTFLARIQSIHSLSTQSKPWVVRLSWFMAPGIPMIDLDLSASQVDFICWHPEHLCLPGLCFYSFTLFSPALCTTVTITD